MKVTTRSEQPQLRPAETPYTAATIKIGFGGRGDADKDRRNEELVFLALLVQVLNPKIPLRRVNDSLRTLINPDQGFDFDAGHRK